MAYLKLIARSKPSITSVLFPPPLIPCYSPHPWDPHPYYPVFLQVRFFHFYYAVGSTIAHLIDNLGLFLCALVKNQSNWGKSSS